MAYTLQSIKDIKKREIDIKTKSLIKEGFTYPDSTYTWSMSENAQINWLGIKISDSTKFPITMVSQEGNVYSLPFSEQTVFIDTAWGTKNGHIQSGSTLKLQVNGAIDIAAVNAIIDNR